MIRLFNKRYAVISYNSNRPQYRPTLDQVNAQTGKSAIEKVGARRYNNLTDDVEFQLVDILDLRQFGETAIINQVHEDIHLKQLENGKIVCPICNGQGYMKEPKDDVIIECPFCEATGYSLKMNSHDIAQFFLSYFKNEGIKCLITTRAYNLTQFSISTKDIISPLHLYMHATLQDCYLREWIIENPNSLLVQNIETHILKCYDCLISPSEKELKTENMRTHLDFHNRRR